MKVKFPKHNIITLLFTIVILYGCKNEVPEVTPTPEPEYIPSENPIEFSNSSSVWDSDGTSRGVEINDFVTGDNIGVYGYYLDGYEEEDLVDASPNFMSNQLVTKTDDTYNTWQYSPTKYWPEEKDDEIFFFAYAPYDVNNEYTSHSYDRNGNPIILHKTPEYAVDTRDLILANQTESYNSCYDNGGISLNFEHKLCKVSFKFLNDFNSDQYMLRVNTIEIQGLIVQTAFTVQDLAYTDNIDTDKGDVISDIDTGALSRYRFVLYDAANYYLDSDGNSVPYTSSYTDITTDEGYMYIDPHIYVDPYTGEKGTVILNLTVEIFPYKPDYVDVTGDYDTEIISTNMLYGIDITSAIESMELGKSYALLLKYNPIEGSGLIVYIIEYWDDVYNQHYL